MKQIFCGKIVDGDVLRFFTTDAKRQFDVPIVEWIGLQAEDLIRYSFDAQDLMGIFRKVSNGIT